MSEHRPSPSLLEQARSGEATALSRLYHRYAEMVHRIAYRLTGNEQDSDDVLQDVFLGLPEALRGYEDRGVFEFWLRSIAAKRSLMALRERKHRREVSLGRLLAVREAAQPEPVIDRVALAKAVERLPDTLRVVFILKEVEGYSHEEVGEILGLEASVSMMRLHRARKQLRAQLGSSR